MDHEFLNDILEKRILCRQRYVTQAFCRIGGRKTLIFPAEPQSVLSSPCGTEKIIEDRRMIKPQSSGGELRRMHSNGKLSLKSVLTRDEYYQTGFKLHVQRAAALIASLGISVALIKLLVFRNYAKGIPALTFNMLILLANVGVLVAQHISVAWLYIPYLVINPFCIVGILRFNVVPMAEIIVKIPALKTLANGKVNGMNNTIISGNDDELREQSGYIKFLELAQPVALMELVLYIVLCGLLFWFQLVVYRAYRFQALAKRRQRMEEVYRSVYVIEPRKKLQRMNTFVA